MQAVGRLNPARINYKHSGRSEEVGWLRRLRRKAEQLGSFLIAGRRWLMEGVAAWLLAGESESGGTRWERKRRAEQHFAVPAERWLNVKQVKKKKIRFSLYCSRVTLSAGCT